MFFCQVAATIVAGTVQLGVQAWMFANIKGMCQTDQPDGFTCPTTRVFGTASIMWGVIGPARQFSKGQIYHGLIYFFPIGFLCPLVQYFVQLKCSNRFLRYVNFPVIFSSTGFIPPATPSNYITWSAVGFIFNYIIRRRHFSWWTKYNCEPCMKHKLCQGLIESPDVLSAGLDAGVAVSTVVIFFTLYYLKNGLIGQNSIQLWWGNTISFNTADANRTSLLSIDEGETFGYVIHSCIENRV